MLTLRTAADADRLRSALGPGRRLAIVGAGFVGAEVASTARSLGTDVTLVDMAPVPLGHVLGQEAGLVLAGRYAHTASTCAPESDWAACWSRAPAA